MGHFYLTLLVTAFEIVIISRGGVESTPQSKKAPKTARRAVGARRAPQPSAGARRRGAERPELLVYYIVLYYTLLYCTLLYYYVLYCIVLYTIVLYFTVLLCTILYCTILY